MSKRTLNETKADSVDMELYRLMVSAEHSAKNEKQEVARKWREAAVCIGQARGYVRQMMARQDIENTK